MQVLNSADYSYMLYIYIYLYQSGISIAEGLRLMLETSTDFKCWLRISSTTQIRQTAMCRHRLESTGCTCRRKSRWVFLLVLPFIGRWAH